MGLSNGSGGYSSGPLYLLSPRTKDKDGKKTRPHLTADVKNATGQLERVPETYTQVAGNLFRAEIKEKTFADTGKTSKDAVFYIRDSEAGYRLPLSFTRASRDLINRLATLLDAGDFTDLTFDYYENKKGYDTWALKQRGQRVEWKYKLEELPAPIEILHPRTGEIEKRDYSDVDAFFEEIVTQIAEFLKANHTPTPTAAPAAEASASVVDEGGGDDGQGGGEEPAAPAPTPAPVAARPAARPAASAPRAAAPAPVARTAPVARPVTPAPTAAAPRAPAATAARPVAARPAVTAPRPVVRPTVNRASVAATVAAGEIDGNDDQGAIRPPF